MEAARTLRLRRSRCTFAAGVPAAASAASVGTAAHTAAQTVQGKAAAACPGGQGLADRNHRVQGGAAAALEPQVAGAEAAGLGGALAAVWLLAALHHTPLGDRMQVAPEEEQGRSRELLEAGLPLVVGIRLEAGGPRAGRDVEGVAVRTRRMAGQRHGQGYREEGAGSAAPAHASKGC